VRPFPTGENAEHFLGALAVVAMIAVVDGDMSALSGEVFRDGFANPAGGARLQGPLCFVNA
jgi:hypothetical protein